MSKPPKHLLSVSRPVLPSPEVSLLAPIGFQNESTPSLEQPSPRRRQSPQPLSLVDDFRELERPPRADHCPSDRSRPQPVSKKRKSKKPPRKGPLVPKIPLPLCPQPFNALFPCPLDAAGAPASEPAFCPLNGGIRAQLEKLMSANSRRKRVRKGRPLNADLPLSLQSLTHLSLPRARSLVKSQDAESDRAAGESDPRNYKPPWFDYDKAVAAKKLREETDPSAQEPNENGAQKRSGQFSGGQQKGALPSLTFNKMFLS